MLFLFIGLNSAQAQDECASYAQDAAEQQQKNLEKNCGFTGIRWYADEGGHRSFCKLFGADLASVETQKRAAQLARCGPANEGAQPEAIEPVAEDAEVDVAPRQCMKSEIAEGKGASRSKAKDAAYDLLGFQKAQLIHNGYGKCLYSALGCAGNSGDYTCWMSVQCCKGP